MTAVGSLIHADWSVDPRKRWAAFAARDVRGAFLIEKLALFQRSADSLVSEGAVQGLLLGFDFPIGVPAVYADALKLERFTELLDRLSEPAFATFGQPAATAAEISLHRPFYPARPGGSRRAILAAAHGAETFDGLMRACERATPTRPAACSVFWTLGGNQVGRGAAAGWREVLAPLKAEGSTRFWPFDGPLATLTSERRVTVAETYPAEAMRFLNIHPGRGFSKRRQADRRAVADRLRAAAARLGVAFAPDVAAAVGDGFGANATGEDRFDCVLGLLGLAAVVSGARAEGTPDDALVLSVEGWVLGQDGAAFGRERRAA